MSEDKALALIDVAAMRGLEIGALNRPRVRKDQGPIHYLDHFSTDELRARYLANEHMRSQLDTIVEVDFVQRDGMSLAECIGDAEPMDYVIGSHLIEHVPNPIGWLHEVAALLRPGGILSLVVPDKRFSFDCNRAETQMRDWIDWYLRDLHVPSFTHLYDFFANVVTIDGTVDTPGIWAGTASYDGVRRSDVPDPDRAALEICIDHRTRGEYVDVHGSVYTPAGFLALLETTTRLGLLDFEVAAFESTARNELEFFVGLRRIAAPGERIDERAAGLRGHMHDEADRLAAAERDAIAEREAPLRAELAAERERRQAAESAGRAMIASRSWKLTAPMRAAARALREVRGRR
jgi:SAM-dependent methyltransferase